MSKSSKVIALCEQDCLCTCNFNWNSRIVGVSPEIGSPNHSCFREHYSSTERSHFMLPIQYLSIVAQLTARFENSTATLSSQMLIVLLMNPDTILVLPLSLLRVFGISHDCIRLTQFPIEPPNESGVRRYGGCSFLIHLHRHCFQHDRQKCGRRTPCHLFSFGRA